MIPITRPTASTTGKPLTPWSLMSAAALCTEMSGPTVITSAVMTSLTLAFIGNLPG